MARATKIKFGDYLNVTDEGGGVIRVDGCAPGGAATFDPFSEAIAALAATRDLRGYWRLGDGGGGPYADTSGYSGGPNDMTVYSGAPYDTPVMSDLGTGALSGADDDGAVSFGDGAGTLAGEHLRSTSATGFSGPFDDLKTICGWVKPTASANTFDGGVFSTLSAGSSFYYGAAFGIHWPARTLFFEHSTGASVNRVTGPALPADEWAFVCSVTDYSTVRLFVNGALVTTGAVTSWGENTPNVCIGLWSYSAGSGSLGPGVFYGGIDEVSVWYDALTDAEIATLAASGGLAEDPTVRSIVSTTGAYTANPNETVLANGTFTVTLPTAVGNSGAEVVVKNIGAGTITVAQDGTETIDGSTTDLTLAAADSVVLVSNGTGWYIISSYSYP